MKNGRKWKIGCLSALTIFCFVLGLVFYECDPCQRVLYFFAVVFLLFLIIQFLFAIITKINDSQSDASIWRNDNIDDETTVSTNQPETRVETKEDQLQEYKFNRLERPAKTVRQ